MIEKIALNQACVDSSFPILQGNYKLQEDEVEEQKLESVKSLVSVIVPIYCISSEYLERCLESLVHQTYQKIEIILIDDGSTDQSGKICDCYKEQYSSIKVIHQENQGVSVARNKGILISTGEYIMFVDPDDWLEKDCVEKALKELERQNVNLLFFQYCLEEDGGTKFIEKNDSRQLNQAELNQIQMDMVAGTGIYGLGPKTAWAKLFRKSTIMENNVRFPVGLKQSEDVVFNLYFDENVNKAFFFDYVGYHYCLYAGSVSRRYNDEICQTVLHILKEYDRFIGTYHNESEIFKTCLGMRIFVYLGLIERLYLFHPQSDLTKDKVLKILDSYFEDEVVNKYLKYCKTKNFSGIRKKVSYLILKGRHYNLYYAYKNIRNKR